MTNLEECYKKKLLEQVKENKKLRQEIEKYKKLVEKNGDFQKQHFEYKKYFEPLIKAYSNLYWYTSHIQDVFNNIIKIYKSNLLLNPIFTEVKISETTKNEIIKETRVLLHKYQSIKVPDKFEIARPIEKGIIPIKKEFELKHFVIKKKK